MSANRLSPGQPRAGDATVQRSKLRFNTGPPGPPPREQSVDALLSPEALGRRPQKAATVDGGPRRSYLSPDGSPSSRRPSNSNTGMPPSPRKDAPRLSALGQGSAPDLLGRRPSQRGSKERPPPLLPLNKAGDRSQLLGGSLPRVVSMPTLAIKEGQRSARGPPSARGTPSARGPPAATPRTPSSGAVSSPVRRNSRLMSSRGYLQVSTRSGESATGSKEQPARSPRTSTRVPSKGALRVSTRAHTDSSAANTKEQPEVRFRMSNVSEYGAAAANAAGSSPEARSPASSSRLGPSKGGLLRVSTRSDPGSSAAGSKEPPSSPRTFGRVPSRGALRVSTRSDSNTALRVSTRSDDSASSSKQYSDRSPSKLSSSRGLLRVNSKNQADGTASTTEPADDGLFPYDQAAVTPRTPRAPDPQVEAMKEIARLRRELMIPMESMQAAMKLFRQHATVPEGGQVFTDGELTKPNLASVMRQMAGSADDVIETCLVDNAFTIADKDENGTISFYEFAIWYSSHSFDEHFNLDARELELRKLSRQLDMPMSEIDTYRRHFDSFDTDGNGTMDRTEFYDMLLKCLKVPKHIGIPTNRVQQMWTDADTDGSGVIEFGEFVVFFSKYFGTRGMEGYYAKNGLVNALHGR